MAMPSGGEHPKTEVQRVGFADVNAGSSLDVYGIVAPFNANVSAVQLILSATATGAATHYKHVKVINKGQAGAGDTVVAELAFSANTIIATAALPKSIPLATTASQLMVTEGDVLAYCLSDVGNGLTFAAGAGLVKFEKR
jgi:hypothetical protein